MNNLEKLNESMKTLKVKEDIDKATSALKKVTTALYMHTDSIGLIVDNIHRLELVSGKSMDELIVLFAAGWELRPPENNNETLCGLLLDKE